MYKLVNKLFPIACEAFEDFIENSTTVSKMEKSLLKRIISTDKWDDVVNDQRSQENVAKKYGISKRDLNEFIETWL